MRQQEQSLIRSLLRNTRIRGQRRLLMRLYHGVTFAILAEDWSLPGPRLKGIEWLYNEGTLRPGLDGEVVQAVI